MIPEDVERRIALYYFHNYLPRQIMYDLEDMLIKQYFSGYDEPSADEMIKKSIRLIEDGLNK